MKALSKNEFPHLFQVPQAPKRLYYEGKPSALELLKNLPENGFAIVGTRKPQWRSIHLIQKTLRDIRSPLVIISGFARGVDRSAHEEAVRNQLPTIAVLGAGLGVDYPRGQFLLRRQIIEAGGLLISEFEKDQPPYPNQFLQRNRLVAAWAKGTWIVEAPKKSGALSTARWARDLDRDCLATPSFPGDPAFSGCENLLENQMAHPFFGSQSLGCLWLPLATQFLLKKPEPSSRPETRSSQIVDQVQAHLQSGRETHVLRIFDQFRIRNWSPKLFFAALQEAFDQKTLVEKNGALFPFSGPIFDSSAIPSASEEKKS